MESILYPEFLYGHLLHGNLKKKKKKDNFGHVLFSMGTFSCFMHCILGIFPTFPSEILFLN